MFDFIDKTEHTVPWVYEFRTYDASIAGFLHTYPSDTFCMPFYRLRFVSNSLEHSFKLAYYSNSCPRASSIFGPRRKPPITDWSSAIIRRNMSAMHPPVTPRGEKESEKMAILYSVSILLDSHVAISANRITFSSCFTSARDRSNPVSNVQSSVKRYICTNFQLP